MSIFENYMRGLQSGQQQALQQLKMQQAAQMLPFEQQLKTMQIERERQGIASSRMKQELEGRNIEISDNVIAGRLAQQALDAPDEATREAIIASGLSRFGIDADPSSITDTELMSLAAQGRAYAETNITEYQKQNLDMQRRRLDLEAKRLEQGDDRLALGINKLETSINTALQEALQRAKAKGKTLGESEAGIQIDAPRAIEVANSTMFVIDELLNHPGLEAALGFQGVIDPRNYTPGTDAYDFALKLEQLKGKAFLKAYDSLKGGGQITEIEGEKAQSSISQLSRRQKKDQFVKELNTLRDIASSGKTKAESIINKEPKKKGGKIMVDANGNRAIVYPDGTFEEIE